MLNTSKYRVMSEHQNKSKKGLKSSSPKMSSVQGTLRETLAIQEALQNKVFAPRHLGHFAEDILVGKPVLSSTKKCSS